MEAPSGTITFLFTDIEGRTTLWQQYPQAMKQTLARHDEILRSTIENHAGYVFKTVGDAFCAAFKIAPDAVESAVCAQRALIDEVWGETGPIRVRMAVHTGSVEERDCDYFGPPVNRVARLLSTGHGGQILLSQATYELVRDVLPTRVRSADLGEHRLKDLTRPEHVYQLLLSDGENEFAPLRSLDRLPNNLPAQPTALIGRKIEVDAIIELLTRDDVRCVTLTGPGGTGKTRLSLQAAAELSDRFDGGVFFVPLASISDTSLVPTSIAQSLGIPGNSGTSTIELVENYIDEKSLLLVLDNYEQIISAAGVVTGLLSRCPSLKILVTSREVLRIQDERMYPVPPLTMPTLDSRMSGESPSYLDLSQFEAVQLFLERAEAVKPGFSITKENAPAIAEICYRLDGLPLAIELAVARLRMLTPGAMLKRLDRRLPLLNRGSRDLPERQRTLATAIEWSYELLDEDDRRLFARLGVFVGGFTLEAAEEICCEDSLDADEPLDVFDGIESLVEKSMLKESGLGGEPRFMMLETIREYAAQKLEGSGEADVLRRLHADYYTSFAKKVAEELTRKDAASWLERAGDDIDNLRASLTFLDESDDARRIEMASDLFLVWHLRGAADEAIRWLDCSFELPVDPIITAIAKTQSALLYSVRGKYESSEAVGMEVLEQGHARNSSRIVGCASFGLGFPHYFQGNFELAGQFFGDAWELLDETVDYWFTVNGLRCRGLSLAQHGHTRESIEDLQRSIDVFRSHGDVISLGYSLRNLGMAHLVVGEFDKVLEYCREALLLASNVHDRWSILRSLERIGIAEALGREEFARSAIILGSTESIRDDIGAPLAPAELKFYTESVAKLREALGSEELKSFTERGRLMSVDQAVAFALDE